MSQNYLRSIIGIVQQEPILFSGTILENIQMEDEKITFEKVVESCTVANAHKFVMDLEKVRF